MSSLPLHPAIVHLPLGLAAVVPLVAAGLALAIWRRWLPTRSWAVVVGLQATIFAGALLAMTTGRQEEERVEDRVPESAIERHEELAERFVWAAGVTAVVSMSALAAGAHPMAAGLMGATTAATAVTAALGFAAGHAGGALVYGPASLSGLSAEVGHGYVPGRARRDDD
jgi:hypothetical protein